MAKRARFELSTNPDDMTASEKMETLVDAFFQASSKEAAECVRALMELPDEALFWLKMCQKLESEYANVSGFTAPAFLRLRSVVLLARSSAPALPSQEMLRQCYHDVLSDTAKEMVASFMKSGKAAADNGDQPIYGWEKKRGRTVALIATPSARFHFTCQVRRGSLLYFRLGKRDVRIGPETNVVSETTRLQLRSFRRQFKKGKLTPSQVDIHMHGIFFSILLTAAPMAMLCTNTELKYVDKGLVPQLTMVGVSTLGKQKDVVVAAIPGRRQCVIPRLCLEAVNANTIEQQVEQSVSITLEPAWKHNKGLFQQRIEANTQEITLGRANFGATETMISTKHCLIHWSPGKGMLPSTFTITDTSSNGTWLNGVRLEKGIRAPLMMNDLITFVDTFSKSAAEVIDMFKRMGIEELHPDKKTNAPDEDLYADDTMTTQEREHAAWVAKTASAVARQLLDDAASTQYQWLHCSVFSCVHFCRVQGERWCTASCSVTKTARRM
jgi:hypothetical protein